MAFVMPPPPALPSLTDKLFALSLDLMVVKDASTNYWTHVNPQVVKTLGYSKAELTSQPSMNFIYPEDRAETEARARSVLSTGIIQNFENRYVAKDGRVVWLSWSAVYEASENVVYAVAKDITKAKAQEEEIAQQKTEMAMISKLNSLGRFAAGIAHEVNNPLTIVYGQTCKLRKLISQSELQRDEILKIANHIENMAARIVRIVNGLRAFTREGSTDTFELVPLKTILEDTLSLCRESFKNQKIELLVDPVPAEWMIRARPVQISQVLLNLLNNAFDAIVDERERWLQISVEATDSVLQMNLVDSGGGVPPEKRPQLFKAFFTTKPLGSGTGLGLNIARMILTAHGGEIFLEETSPRTCFVVRLPRAV
jgi:PAS domain S-box-containing protein